MTFWYAIRERESGKWLAAYTSDADSGTFVSDRALALKWNLDHEWAARTVARALPIAVDVLSISDAP